MRLQWRQLVAPFLAGAVVWAGMLLVVPAQASILDGCREASNAQDLNGDGFDDAAVGDPYADVNGQA